MDDGEGARPEACGEGLGEGRNLGYQGRVQFALDCRDPYMWDAAGTSNGLALKIIPSDAGAPTVRIYAEFFERSYT